MKRHVGWPGGINAPTLVTPQAIVFTAVLKMCCPEERRRGSVLVVISTGIL